MQAVLNVANQEFTIECADCDQRRLEDLAQALDARLARFSGDEDAMRRLVLTALSLLDQAQATSAALALAREEIERLTDMVVEARMDAQNVAVNDERGRVGVLVAHGAA
jgi:cell division protein ZapA (FtsZ GTPase activity inhibitor)